MKKVPMRTCVVSKEKCEKRDLLRIVRTPEKEVIIDETGKANGRGAYISKNKEAIALAKKNKVLDRAFQIKVDTSIYDELLKNL